jgi:hypothetical protein
MRLYPLTSPLMMVMFSVFCSHAATAQSTVKAGNWTADCKVDRMTDEQVCAIDLPFHHWQAQPIGDFVLLIGAGKHWLVSITGAPSIVMATMRIDRYPAVTCHGPEFCHFTAADEAAILRELPSASTVLLTIATVREVFEFTPYDARGYGALIAKLYEVGALREPQSESTKSQSKRR